MRTYKKIQKRTKKPTQPRTRPRAFGDQSSIDWEHEIQQLLERMEYIRLMAKTEWGLDEDTEVDVCFEVESMQSRLSEIALSLPNPMFCIFD